MSELSREEVLENLYPVIEWRRPVTVTRTDGVTRLGCRFCIAFYGLEGRDIEQLWTTIEEWRAHMDSFHPPAKPRLARH